jgi:hypothetical protein
MLACLFTTEHTSLSPRNTEPKNPRTSAATATTVTHSPALSRPSMTSPSTAAVKAPVSASSQHISNTTAAAATPTMQSPRPARPVPPAPSKQLAAVAADTADTATAATDANEGRSVNDTRKTAMLTDGDCSDGLPDGSGVVEGSVTILNSSERSSIAASSKQSTGTATNTTVANGGSGGAAAAVKGAHGKQDTLDRGASITAHAEQPSCGDAMDIDNAEDRYAQYKCTKYFI